MRHSAPELPKSSAAFLPEESPRQRLDAIPGVNTRTIEVVIAEIGNDMTRFPTAGDLCSWAGISPTNDRSAGKIKRSAIKPGNRWLRRGLIESARAASHKKDSYFKAQYSRLAARRGKNRAAVAVAHSLLVVIYELLSHPESKFQDLGANYFDQLDPQRLTRHLVKARLESGSAANVTLTKDIPQRNRPPPDKLLVINRHFLVGPYILRADVQLPFE